MIIRILTVFFAIVGVLSAAAITFYSLIGEVIFGGVDPPSIEQVVASPDGNYNAMRVFSSGGGAAGWCREYVSIHNAAESESQIALAYPDAKKKMVFSTRCDSSQFSMKWKSIDRLIISYRLSGESLIDIELKDKDSSGKIWVSFEQQP